MVSIVVRGVEGGNQSGGGRLERGVEGGEVKVAIYPSGWEMSVEEEIDAGKGKNSGTI